MITVSVEGNTPALDGGPPNLLPGNVIDQDSSRATDQSKERVCRRT
jgi:hypothetical protein